MTKAPVMLGGVKREVLLCLPVIIMKEDISNDSWRVGR